MRALLKPHQYSTSMKYLDISESEWRELVSKPLIRANKDEAPLVIWGKMTPTVEVSSEDARPRCIGDNIEHIYALQVDIDSGISIEAFKRDYEKYIYFLYTSYSYGFKAGDRFRAVFPLKERIKTEWLVPPVKAKLREMFPEADDTCWDRGHWQIMPCIREKGAPYEYYIHDDGEFLSFAFSDFAKMAKEYRDGIHWKREIAEADRDHGSDHSHALAYVQKIFDETQEGSRDKTVYSKLRWLRDDVGCTYSEVMALRPPVGFDEEYILKVEKMFGR